MNSEPDEQANGAGEIDVVAKVEEEYVDPEPEQAILAPPANNLRQGMSSEPIGRVFLDETGMEAQRRRPRFQIAPNDKGKELIEEESELESSDSDEDMPTRLARISRNHVRVLAQHARVLELEIHLKDGAMEDAQRPDRRPLQEEGPAQAGYYCEMV